MSSRDLAKLNTEACNHLFIGGYDALTCLKARLGKIVRGVRAAHHLCNYADLVVLKYLVEIVYHEIAKGAIGKIAEIKNVFYLIFAAKSALDKLFVLCKYLGGAASDASEAK